MHKSLLIGLSLTAAMVATGVSAAEYGRPITASIVTNNDSGNPTIRAGIAQQKQVYLMDIKLTAKEKQTFLHRATSQLMNATADDALPKKFDQGMNGVPVLDQGRHGSCVTFANTAAVDAVLGKGDYVSQLCSLELGSYFEKRGYEAFMPSGWDGSVGSLVLNQMMQFGIVNQVNQKNKSCAGLTSYPVDDEQNRGNPISLEDYHQLSETLPEGFYWDPMLTMRQRTQWDAAQTEANAQKVLTQVKQAVATKTDGNVTRVTFATLLPVSYCSAGACARFHATNDTWAFTDAMKRDSNPQFGGHEMVIIGYDDNATATDNAGKKHKGLLTLRNSWGTTAGDRGNYYMTYEFFKQYVMETQKIGVSNN
jgi:hypothetical protein